MSTDFSPSPPSWRYRLALSLLVTLAYVLVFFPLYHYALIWRSAIILSVVPVILVAAIYALPGGLIAGLLTLPLNVLLLYLAGERPPFGFMGMNFWVTHIILICAGVAAGYLKTIRVRLERELGERTRAEVALSESRNRLELALKGAQVGLWDHDFRTDKTFVNPHWAGILGYTLEEIDSPSSFWEQRLHPDDSPAVHKNLEAHFEGRTTFYKDEYRIRHKQGNWIWILTHGQVVERDQEGNPLRFVGIHRDITRQKQAEEDLRASEERFRALVENLDEGITVVDPQGKIIFQAPVVRRILGRELEERIGGSVFDPVHPDDLLNVKAYFAGLIEHPGEKHTAEYLARHKDGSWRRLEVDGINLLDNPAVQGIVIIYRDITERTKVEEELRRSEERFRALVENLDEGITIFDTQGKSVYQAPVVRRILGWELGERIGSSVFDIIHPDDLPRINEYFAWLLEHPGEKRTIEARARHKDGSWQMLEVDGINLLDNPALQGIVVVYRDISERIQSEEALRHSEERFRAIVENLEEDISIVDPQGTILYEAPVRTRILGREPEERMDRSVFDLTHPDDLPRVKESFSRLLQQPGGRLTEEVRARHKDGSWRSLMVEGSNLLDNPALQGIVILSRDITSRKQTEAQVQRHLQRISALREVDTAILTVLDMRITLDLILRQVTEQLGVDAAAIMLYNPASMELEVVAKRGFKTSTLAQTRARLGQDYAGRVALERRMLHIPDLSSERSVSPHLSVYQAEGFTAYIAVPLTAKGEIEGVLEIFHRQPFDPAPEELEFLETLANQAALAIDNANLFEDLQRKNIELLVAYDTTLEGWSRTLELRDQETEGHTRRVTEATLHLAQAMGIRDVELDDIRRGALLHDIGKMGVPDNILLKPGPLTDEEWEIMRQHPTLAYTLLSPIPFLRRALDIPYCHHEKWDGSGYPRGLKADQIPLPARIFAIVDVWDALRSERPYRQAWPEEKALEHIRRQAGIHFDPQVVEVFLESLDLLPNLSS